MAQQDFQGSNGAVNFSLNVPDELGTLDPNSELYGQIVSVYTLGQSYRRLLASAVGPNANTLQEVARSQRDSADNLILSYGSNSPERALLLNTFQAGEISDNVVGRAKHRYELNRPAALLPRETSQEAEH